MDVTASKPRAWPSYNTIWRWHFYAGLFSIPFFVVLSITGAIYLFKPQFESVVEQPYEHLQITGAPQTPSAQVNAALAAVPGTVLYAYELPATPQSAVRILLGQRNDLTRVYVHPQTLQILNIEKEDDRFMRVMHRLHGNLLIGDRGSNIVELAASWGIVMIITGLYLWWPRQATSLAGILYPRFNGSKRVFWRDMHAVTGFWISFFTLFLLISGLPWAKSWGGMLKEIRHYSAGHVVQQDWTTGRGSELAERRAANTQMSDAEHAEHQHHHRSTTVSAPDYSAIDKLVPVIAPLDLAFPVQIQPPSMRSPDWMARSMAQNRPLRVDIALDPASATIKSRKNFADRPLLDRIIGIAVAIHEGQLFGWLNQALGVLTALGLVLVSVSSVILWLSRRQPGILGAPTARADMPKAYLLIATILILGTLLPFMGLTLLLTLLLEHLVFRHIPRVRDFLGLQPATT